MSVTYQPSVSCVLSFIWYSTFPNVLFCKRVHMVHGGPWGASTFPPNAVIKRNTRCHQGGNHIKSGPNCQTNWTAHPAWVFSFLHVIVCLLPFSTYMYINIHLEVEDLHWRWCNYTRNINLANYYFLVKRRMDLIRPPLPPPSQKTIAFPPAWHLRVHIEDSGRWGVWGAITRAINWGHKSS